MKKWEDIVKDKMEEPEGALPESVFAEFRARREAAAVAPSTKRFPMVWAVVPAVAAGLAAVLLLRGPVVPEGDIRIIRQPSAPLAAVTDLATVDEPVQTTPLISQAVTPKAVVRPSPVRPMEMTPADNTDPNGEISIINHEEETASPEEKDSATDSSPFISDSKSLKPIKLKAGPAAGIIAGGGLLAAVATPHVGGFGKLGAEPQGNYNDGTVTNPDLPTDEPAGEYTLNLPLRVGVSARVPLSDRLNLTSGLEYCLYSSIFTYTLSGKKTQLAHYLGIPVRLDWTLASGKRLDVYFGGGFEADYCLGATLAGERIAKDGFGFSLLGAGGIQYNLTKRIGLYVEPEISWTIPSDSHVLQTYRSDNPVMFSLSSGIRINVGK